MLAVEHRTNGSASQRAKKPFIRGHEMICPRCKRYHDILAYIAMKQIEVYEDDTAPVYKCPSCRWVFAPSEPIVLTTGPLVKDHEAIAPEVVAA